MASSPVKFFFVLLVVCGIGWVVFVFAARLLAWFLSRILGASVGFRVAGCNCLRDVTVRFRKGAVESVSIGEIKLSLRKSLVKLGFSFISRDPKLQVLICDFEVVIRPSEQSKKDSKSRRSRPAGKGKWMIFTNMARLLSVSVTELVMKVPKAVIDVKDLRMDVSKHGGSNPILDIKLHLIPFLVHLGDSRLSFDQSSNCSQTDCLVTREVFSAFMEKNPAPFVCEDLSVACELGHEREGVKIRNLDVISGDVTVNLNENLFRKTNMKSEIIIAATAGGGATLDVPRSKKSQKNKFSFLSLKKHLFVFPEKTTLELMGLRAKHGESHSGARNTRYPCCTLVLLKRHFRGGEDGRWRRGKKHVWKDPSWSASRGRKKLSDPNLDTDGKPECSCSPISRGPAPHT